MGTQRINLLFIVNNLEFGGAEKHLVTLLNGLNTDRFRLGLAFLKNVDTLIDQIDTKRLSGGVFCCNVSKKIDIDAINALACYIERGAVDIVICINTYSLLYGFLTKLRSKRHIKLIEIFHSSDLLLSRGPSRNIKMGFYRLLFFFSDMLVYVSENQRKYWRSNAVKARFDIVINNGIDLNHFTDSSTSFSRCCVRQAFGFMSDDYVIGLCAAFRPEKAHGDLLKAVVTLKALLPRVKCLLIGDGPDRSKIEGLIDDLNLARDVRITGFMEDVRNVISACDVMVLPSKFETFSISSLESMALGKPMVMTRVGGASEQVTSGENGYLFDYGDIESLADALYRLSDSKLRKTLGDRARLLVNRRYNMDIMITAYEELFFEVGKMPRRFIWSGDVER